MATPPPADFIPAGIPEYSADVAELLAQSEHHPDPVVRATRKIVAQAALALHVALKAANGPRSSAALNNGATAAVDRLRRLGTTTANVRAWAEAAGVECSSKGVLPTHVIDEYERAHGNDRAPG